MSSLIVEVCEISSIEKHPNADRLSVVGVKGWNCIVGLDQYKVGDLVVFVPPDCIIPPALIEKYNLEYLKKNGKTGTVKLRGHISQGLVLDLPEGKWKVGDDVSKVLGITKWQPPEPPMMRGTKQVSKKKMNPNFSKYTDIENVKNYNSVFKNGDFVVITEKIHGCLESGTKILLADGSFKKIEEIVKNKLSLDVWGMDASGNLTTTKITNWFNNGKTDEWLKIKYKRRGFRTGGNWYGSLDCTPNHQIFSNGKYIDAKELKIGDSVCIIKNIDELNYVQQSILTGIMLGDGSYQKRGFNSADISFGHKKNHEEYTDYILNNLGYMAGNKQKEMISGYETRMTRGRTISSYSIYKNFDKWIVNGIKKIPDDIKLNPICLAFWYMDDGNLIHFDGQEDRVGLATCGFDEEDIDILLKSFKDQLDINAEKYFHEKYWRIKLKPIEAEKFFILIAPYICAVMQYKIPSEFKNRNCKFATIGIQEFNKAIFEQEIIDIKYLKIDRSNDSNYKKYKYDIETETHNFFANEILVHNSNARYGNLEIIIDKNQPFFYRLTSWFKKNILRQRFEFCYGSHNVQISGNLNRNSYYGEDIWGIIGQQYKMDEIIPKDYIVYGEIYGDGIQDLTYGLKNKVDFVVFDVKYKDTYLDWESVVEFCQERDLPIVPLLYAGKFNKEKLMECTEGNSVLASNQIKEGAVVKPLMEENSPLIGRKILKSINPAYLLRKSGTEFK